MSSKKENTGNEYLFELATFLAMSARGCIDEPPSYGPFRLIDALSRLIDLPKHAACLSEDKFLENIKKEVDEKKYLVMSDMKKFRKFLDEMVSRFAVELKKRSSK
jgi:hypothetical protein